MSVDAVLFEIGSYWVCHSPKDKKHRRHFEVYRSGVTHSQRVAVIGFEGEDGLKRAIAEARRRHEAEARP